MGHENASCGATEHDYIPVIMPRTGTLVVICRKCGGNFTID